MKKKKEGRKERKGKEWNGKEWKEKRKMEKWLKKIGYNPEILINN